MEILSAATPTLALLYAARLKHCWISEKDRTWQVQFLVCPNVTTGMVPAGPCPVKSHTVL